MAGFDHYSDMDHDGDHDLKDSGMFHAMMDEWDVQECEGNDDDFDPEEAARFAARMRREISGKPKPPKKPSLIQMWYDLSDGEQILLLCIFAAIVAVIGAVCKAIGN